MNINSFIITSLAGISTILGFFILGTKKEEGIVPKSLGFSAGVMMFVSLFDLLPTSFHYFQNSFLSGFHIIFCILFFLLGILISVSMNESIHRKIGENSPLFQIGILSMIAIVLHNIPEGIITYLTSTIEYKTGIILALSIACHNIPEGICIAIPIYYSTGSKLKAFKYVLISALSEPLGAIIAAMFLEKNLSDMVIGILLALVAGIMISLTITEILPEAKNYSKKDAFLYCFIGIIILFITHLLFQ